MHVARYWSAVRVVRRHAVTHAEITQTVWGGSDVSESDAQAAAERNAAGLRDQLILPRDANGAREDRNSGYSRYPGRAQPEPMIDEVLEDSGARVGAVTLNSYGAEVLNTSRLVFVDIDLDHQSGGGRGLIGTIRSMFSGKQTDTGESRFAEFTGPMIGWVAAGVERGARVYRTAAGLRFLLVRPAMDPGSEETGALMHSFRGDPKYVRLCKVQQCFRARLTPKPWRIGIAQMRVRYSAYRDGDPRVLGWIERYREASRGYAVCKLLGEYGSVEPPDGTTAKLIEMHDLVSGVGIDLPLA